MLSLEKASIETKNDYIEKFVSSMHHMMRLIWKYRAFYVLLLPGLIYFLVFKYAPMYGISIAFKDFSPFRGIHGSEWVGVKHFVRLFESPDFWNVLRNTLIISLYKLIFGFPAPIILALLLNELRKMMFKRTIQTIVYLPHFISWVIVGSIAYVILSPSAGVVNYLIELFGGEPIFFLANRKWFRPILVMTEIWKNSGWGTIVYLAAITSISPEIYESAIVDGANRWQQALHITLPSIRSVIVVLLILRVGRILDVGFQQILVLYNPAVYDIADVFGTFVYRVGLTQAQYSFATAVGLFKGVVGLVMVITTNKIAKWFGQSGIW